MQLYYSGKVLQSDTEDANENQQSDEKKTKRKSKSKKNIGTGIEPSTTHIVHVPTLAHDKSNTVIKTNQSS